MSLINRTYFTIPILGLLILLFSFLLYNNLTEKVKASDNPVIGTLTFKTRTIQRKYDNEVIWESITTATEIHNKDTIRTENLSDAVLTLEDGTKIQIGENSMILVDFSDNNWNLNFAYGTVATERSANASDSVMNIQAGNSKIQVGAGGLSLDKSGESLNVKIDSGQAKVTNGGQTQEIAKDQIANLSSEGISVNDIEYKLLTPLDRSISVIEGNNKSIVFSWSKLGKSKLIGVKIEVSTDPGFKRIVSTQNIKSDSISLSLAPGSYYWRLAYKDDKASNRFTAISKFSIEKKENLRLFTPSQGQNYSFIPGSTSLPISVSWSKLQLASNYNVQISKSSDFANIILQKDTFNNSISFSDIPEGNYFVRVLAKSSIEEMGLITSNSHSFSVTTRIDAVKPSLFEPSNGKTVSKFSIPDSGLFFSWKDSSDFSEYEFYLSNNANFTNPIAKDSSSSNFYKLTNDIKPGKYFWKIIGKTKTGIQKESDVYQFQITESINLALLRPNNGSQIDLDDASSLNLSWKPFPNIGTVTLEISKNKNMESTILKEKVSGTSYKFVTDSTGIYYWRLVWNGDGESAESEIFNFTTSKKLVAPNLQIPSKNQIVDMTLRDSLIFQWSSVVEADLYQLLVYDVTGIKEREIINVKIKELKYILTDLTKLNEGKFRWEVKSLTKNNDDSFSSSNTNRADFFIKLDSGSITKILTPGKVYVE